MPEPVSETRNDRDAPRNCPCGFPGNGRRFHSGGFDCTAWLGQRAIIEAAKARREAIGGELLTAHERAAYDVIIDLRECLHEGVESAKRDAAGWKALGRLLAELVPADVLWRALVRLTREADDASYNGRDEAGVLGRAATALAAASLERRRRLGPQSESERAIGGHELVLGHDAGGARHFLDARPVSCGTTLEWNRGGIWTHVRYEASLNVIGGRVSVSLCDALGDHALEPGDRFRWPERRS